MEYHPKNEIKIPTYNSIPSKIYFNNKCKIKILFHHAKVEIIHHQIHSTRDMKEELCQRRIMMLDAHMDRHIEIKGTENGSYMGKHKRHFAYYSNLFKE